MSQVELLAPAGSRESFLGALAAGADAFYLAGQKFGARAYADNFSAEELDQTIREAHLFGKKVYLTVNTLTREDELPELVEFVSARSREGLDGVIVQDLGVLSALHRSCPELKLHASTQMSVTGTEGVRFLKKLGVCRIVPARELSIREIRKIREEEDIEIEAFIHGAMCYSYSGRCLMSSFLGGRSGNRGRCAGTCRLSYKVLDENLQTLSLKEKKEPYPISMKDLCVLKILPELIDAGIDSFKIEGRMKKPEYAAGVTAIYRKYIERYDRWNEQGRRNPWTIDEKDEKDLLSLYIRTELSDGYYHRRSGVSMITMGKPGYAGADETLLKNIRRSYLETGPRIAISGELTFLPGEKICLRVRRLGRPECEVRVCGETVQTAVKRPLTGAELKEKLQKTGDTFFQFAQLKIHEDGNGFLPISAIASVKREALRLLEEKSLENGTFLHSEQRMAQKDRQADPPEAETDLLGDAVTSHREPEVIVMVTTADQYRAAAASGAQILITENADQELCKACMNLLALPAVFRMEERPFLDKVLDEQRFDGFLVRNMEELEILLQRNYHGKIYGDASLYQWNREAASVLSLCLERSVLPLELSGRELYRTFGREGLQNSIFMIYGRIPMMITANCIRKTAGRCRQKETGFYYLKDRKNEKFPVRTVCGHCHNIIYNSVPLSLHHYLSEQPIRSCGAVLYSFTTEDGREVSRILAGEEPAEYTTGHYKKGAE